MSKLWRYVPLVSLLIFVGCFAFMVATKINLVDADLGRHIENGRLLLTGTSQQVHDILHSNYYSYTNTTFPFINHHWGIGVIFYLIWLYAGFKGLSLFYIFCASIMFITSFLLAQKKSNTFVASLFGLVLMPILSSRREIRPEVITYLFALIFYAVLWLYKEKKLKKYWLFGLVVLELAWVNIHIGFFLGEVIVGLFFIYELVQSQKDWREIKFFGLLLCVTALSTIFNPNLIRGALYPLSIFSNYGYTLFENQSVFTLERLGFYSYEFALYKLMLVFTGLITLLYIFKKKEWRFFFEPLTLIMVVMSVLSFTAERNLIMFAIFAVPYLSLLLGRLISGKMPRWMECSITVALLIILVFSTIQVVQARGLVQGIGLAPGVEDSAQFVRVNGLTGPIFNDYDNGSYLEYELHGSEKVFVDNRPEAYPASFFSDIYIKSQENTTAWKALDDKYHFNTIWFHRNDLTTWAKVFLNTRAKDPDWALVYLDNYSIIFVKRSLEHKALITKFEIPIK